MLKALGYRQVTIEGHPLWVNPVSGRVFPAIHGGAEGDPAEGDPPKAFTQADVDRLVGGARVEAKRVAANELAEQLGCTVEEAKAKIEQLTKAEDDKKTDAQKALDAANQAKAEAAADKAAAAKERFDAKVERKLIAAGVGKDLDDAKATAALARARRLLDLDLDADDTAIAAEIDAVKADVPSLFTTEAGHTPPPGRKPPTPPKAPGQQGGGAKSIDEVGRQALIAAGIRPRDAA